MNINNQNEFISEIAKRARFTKSDIKTILDTITEIFEELVFEAEFEDGEDTNILLRSRGFGILYIQRLGERKGNKGQILPESTRVVFKLGENIRRAGKDHMENYDDNGDDDDLTDLE